jgi:hypothetical protein
MTLDAPTGRDGSLVVPRFPPRVQSECATAPTWTHPFARNTCHLCKHHVGSIVVRDYTSVIGLAPTLSVVVSAAL